MKSKTTNARLVWKQFEDVLVPRLRLSVIDRAVYSHLFRHSHLKGKRRVRFTILWLAHGIRLCIGSARQSVRRLAELGVLRLVERGIEGHVVEVRLPDEIPAIRAHANADSDAARSTRPLKLEDMDFMQRPALRNAIHARERARCFYCLRRTSARKRCLDHVVPRALSGPNSYRNLVSCCHECNAQKGERPAKDFLRWLFREGKLTSEELKGRLRALEKLAKGGMRPEVRK